jgi:hypothetical protein
MSQQFDEKAQKIHNPLAEFDTPSDVVKDSELSPTEKKKALENLEQDAHQLMTASNEGMAPENDHVAEHEPKLDEVVKAQQRIGEKQQHKPAHKAHAAGLAPHQRLSRRLPLARTRRTSDGRALWRAHARAPSQASHACKTLIRPSCPRGDGASAVPDTMASYASGVIVIAIM